MHYQPTDKFLTKKMVLGVCLVEVGEIYTHQPFAIRRGDDIHIGESIWALQFPCEPDDEYLIHFVICQFLLLRFYIPLFLFVWLKC